MRLTLRYTTPDMRCRGRRCECDGGISTCPPLLMSSTDIVKPKIESITNWRRGGGHPVRATVYYGNSASPARNQQSGGGKDREKEQRKNEEVTNDESQVMMTPARCTSRQRVLNNNGRSRLAAFVLYFFPRAQLS